MLFQEQPEKMNKYRPILTACGMYVVKWESNVIDLLILDKETLTIAPRPISKHASSSHNTWLVGGEVAPRGWWHTVVKRLQCLQFPAWEQPLSPVWGRLRFPAWEHLPVPCLGTFAVPVWSACQFPAWERLPMCSMPSLGMLAVPAWDTCQLQFPAWDACQFPAWECLPVPFLGTFASALPWHIFAVPAWDVLPVPCLGTFANALPGHVCQSLPGTPASSLPGTAICSDAVPS